MERDGLIEPDANHEPDDSSDRKSFRLTDVGQEELATWLASPLHSNRKLKDDFYLKTITLTNVLDRHDQLNALLWQQREVYLQQLRELEQALVKAEIEEDSVTSALIEGAILHVEADLAWLDRIEERVIQPTATEMGGHS
ncbi:hypothetical protein KFU94_02360 [Chloroflexi bacterium TSY]|nr:hypothetical protein [Chloroflexi bacterium TSY]